MDETTQKVTDRAPMVGNSIKQGQDIPVRRPFREKGRKDTDLRFVRNMVGSPGISSVSLWLI